MAKLDIVVGVACLVSTVVCYALYRWTCEGGRLKWKNQKSWM